MAKDKFHAPALGWEFGGHIRLFTAGTVEQFLEENGFLVEELRSNVVSLMPTKRTRRPWSGSLGRVLPSLGEVLIVKARKGPAEQRKAQAGLG